MVGNKHFCQPKCQIKTCLPKMLGDPTSSHLSSNKGHHFCKKKTNQNHLLGSCLVGGWTNPVWKNMLVNMQVFPQFSGRKKNQTTKQICIFSPTKKIYSSHPPSWTPGLTQYVYHHPVDFSIKPKKPLMLQGCRELLLTKRFISWNSYRKHGTTSPFCIHGTGIFSYMNGWFLMVDV